MAVESAVDIRAVNHWIGGKLAPSHSGRSGVVYNPATGEAQASVDFASAAEVDEAVAVAREAFATWRASALSRRAECMFKLRDLVDQNRRRIAELVTLEHGKTMADALGEVARGLENIEFACGIPNLLKGGYSEQASRGIDVYQIRQPLGVVAGITPFNFPAMVPHVDVPQRHRLRQHLHPEALREGSLGEPAAGRSDAPGRRSRRRLQRGSGRQGRRRPAAGASRREGRQLRGLDSRGEGDL